MMNSMKKKDLTGLKFNRITVLKFVGKHKSYTSAWECICECGKVFIIAGYALTTGHTKSCGCLRFDYNSIVGNYHPWCDVLKKIQGRYKGKSALYECKCKLCGRIFKKNSSYINNKKYKSCGCENRKIGQKPGIASAKDIFTSYIRNAKNRNIKFEIDFEYFLEISQKECFYCGVEPLHLSKISNNGEFYYNGIDRINNENVYSKNNIVTCCGQCNKMKMNLSYSDFIGLVEKIYNRIKK